MFRKILKKLICFIKSIILSPSDDETLLFRAGFSGNVAVKYSDSLKSQDAILTGKDVTLSNSHNWNMISNCHIGSHKIQFIGGDKHKRKAIIIDNPDVSYNNKVLLFSINDHWKDSNGNGFSRIQLPIYDNPKGIHEMYIKTRMYLGNEFNLMRNMPDDIPNAWGPIIFEMFNDEVWANTPYPFRLKLTMKKIPNNSELMLVAEGQTFDNGRHNSVWKVENTEFNIKTGKWIDIEYYLKNGNRDTGRFIMKAKYDDYSEKCTIFNIKDSVHHPNDPNPYGIRHIQPLKLYNSTNLTEFFKQNGKKMEIYWDGLEIWKNKKIIP